MESLLAKFPLYHFISYLIPGALLAILLKLWVPVLDIFALTTNPWLLLVIFYFLGILNAQIGKIVVAPLYKYAFKLIINPLISFIQWPLKVSAQKLEDLIRKKQEEAAKQKADGQDANEQTTDKQKADKKKYVKPKFSVDWKNYKNYSFSIAALMLLRGFLMWCSNRQLEKLKLQKAHTYYQLFIRAQQDDKNQALNALVLTSTEFANYMTLLIIVLLLKLIFKMEGSEVLLSSEAANYYLAFCIMIFVCAFKKQKELIVKRVKQYDKQEPKDKESNDKTEHEPNKNQDNEQPQVKVDKL